MKQITIYLGILAAGLGSAKADSHSSKQPNAALAEGQCIDNARIVQRAAPTYAALAQAINIEGADAPRVSIIRRQLDRDLKLTDHDALTDLLIREEVSRELELTVRDLLYRHRLLMDTVYEVADAALRAEQVAGSNSCRSRFLQDRLDQDRAAITTKNIHVCGALMGLLPPLAKEMFFSSQASKRKFIASVTPFLEQVSRDSLNPRDPGDLARVRHRGGCLTPGFLQSIAVQ